MKISVVTPCRNAERYLEETALSVLSQRGEFEIDYVIVDGDSTDGTRDAIGRLAADVRSGRIGMFCRNVAVRHLSEPDAGMYDALAKGFGLAGGEVVAYINADDFYLPNAFSTVAEVFERYPEVAWLTGMPVSYNEKGQITDTFLPAGYDGRLIRAGIFGGVLPHIQQESTFFRSGLLRHVDFDVLKRHRYAGDYYLWHSFSRHADLYVVQSCLAGYRTRPGQLTGRMDLYEGEFSRICGPRTLSDVLRGRLLKAARGVLSAKYNRKIGRRIIHFRNGEWVIER